MPSERASISEEFLPSSHLTAMIRARNPLPAHVVVSVQTEMAVNETYAKGRKNSSTGIVGSTGNRESQDAVENSSTCSESSSPGGSVREGEKA